MTEKDKEIQDLRRQVEELEEENAALKAKIHDVLTALEGFE